MNSRHKFQATIYDYFQTHKRDFPWRNTVDPYQILVSEIMLQQTQADRVVGKFNDFIVRFPDWGALARAPLADVLRMWQGLGYNRRAIALKRCAEKVCGEFGGALPRTAEALEQLPGIGPYTARAVLAFAHNKPSVFIETNIRTVYIHFFFKDAPQVSDREILVIAGKMLDDKNPRKWYSALMDYGAMLKKTNSNPSRRSAHYTKQTKFKGSNREIRGAVLRALATHTKGLITKSELLKNLPFGADKTVPILVALEKEGFIVTKGSKLSLS